VTGSMTVDRIGQMILIIGTIAKCLFEASHSAEWDAGEREWIYVIRPIITMPGVGIIWASSA
jgi:hypothetical protein